MDRLSSVDIELAVRFLDSCCNFDGGYGAVPGAESHSGQSMGIVAFKF
jgi:geranylgeranyl transferase type-2 subunit beta